MKSIYDSMSNNELASLSHTEWAFQRRGTDLAQAKRNAIHAKLLEAGEPYTVTIPSYTRGGSARQEQRPYTRYSSPPREMLSKFDDAQSKHWFPELFAISKASGHDLTIEDTSTASHSAFGKRRTFKITYGTYALSFQYHYWPGCCAMGMVSTLDGYGPFTDPNSGVAKAVAKRIVPVLRMLLNVHQVMFAYSKEEIESQDVIWKSWGGVDLQTPFDSFKTGNLIHTAAIDLANAHDISDARARRAHNDEQREEYNDTDDEWSEDFE